MNDTLKRERLNVADLKLRDHLKAQVATKRHPSFPCNAHKRGENCGHMDVLAGKTATIVRPGRRWTGRIEWVGRWTEDDAVASVTLRVDDEREHFGIDKRTTLIIEELAAVAY